MIDVAFIVKHSGTLGLALLALFTFGAISVLLCVAAMRTDIAIRRRWLGRDVEPLQDTIYYHLSREYAYGNRQHTHKPNPESTEGVGIKGLLKR